MPERCVRWNVRRAALVVVLVLLVMGCSSGGGRACPQFVPASGLTVDATAFAAGHPSSRRLLACVSMSLRCTGGVSVRLRPRLPASVFVPLGPGDGVLHVRVVVSGPAGTVLFGKMAALALRRVADPACSGTSSYRAIAVVTWDGTLRTG